MLTYKELDEFSIMINEPGDIVTVGEYTFRINPDGTLDWLDIESESEEFEWAGVHL